MLLFLSAFSTKAFQLKFAEPCNQGNLWATRESSAGVDYSSGSEYGGGVAGWGPSSWKAKPPNQMPVYDGEFSDFLSVLS